MTLDYDESSWVKELLRHKAQADLNCMQQLFVINYCKLLDSTVRKHYMDMCYKCRGLDGENGQYHICEDETASLVIAFGGAILEYATDEEKQKTWQEFLEDVQQYGIFKKVVLNWFKSFTNVKEKLDEDRELYYEFMQLHFPNPTQNPHQLFLGYD